MVWTLNPACFNSPMRPFRGYRSEPVPPNSIRNGCAFHWLLIDDRQPSTMLERLVEIGVYRVWLGEMVIHQTHVYRVTRRSGKVGVRVSGRRIGRRSGTGCPSDCSVSLNNWGAITGTYIDANHNYHGDLRNPKGKIVTVDPAGSIATGPVGINDAGAVTGVYIDANNVFRGFVRIPD